MTIYLACFDIVDDKIRNKVGKILMQYGDRVQKSVFEVSIKDQAELIRLKTEIKDILEQGDDCRFYHLCVQCRGKSSDVFGQAIGTLPAAIIV